MTILVENFFDELPGLIVEARFFDFFVNVPPRKRLVSSENFGDDRPMRLGFEFLGKQGGLMNRQVSCLDIIEQLLQFVIADKGTGFVR